MDEDIIRGKSRLFYNDIKNLKQRSPLIIISGGQFEIETFLKYDEIDIQIIKKPFLLKDLINKIEYLNQKDNLNNRTSLNFKIPLIDKTNKTKIIFDSIHKIINNNLNALVSGENGTGKRQIANTINALREPDKKLLEINFLDYKNNNFEKLLLNKISKDEFLNSKFIKSSDVSKTILLTDIEIMPLNIQNLLLSILKSKNASSLTYI